MPTVKKRTFAGDVCEQEVYTIAPNVKKIGDAQPLLRFRTEEERERHKWLISRRRHARLVNENCGPQTLYCTLTLDNFHEVHTFGELRRVRDNYMRRLQTAAPDAQIFAYMGRGKGTARLHLHFLINNVDKQTIVDKWTEGWVVRVEHLRAHNYYNGVDYGRDYTGLANYLFDHWTPEQGERSHRYKATRNTKKPDQEPAQIARRSYSEIKPPRAPKGYTLVEIQKNRFGYMLFKYVKKEPDAAGEPPYMRGRINI